MNLSKNFTLAEATFSSTALRRGIDNTPTPRALTNMTQAAQGMEEVRTILGDRAIHIDSWLRVPALNEAVGGAPASDHMQGWAVDFVCPAFGTPAEIVRAIVASKLNYDKVIMEGNWVHISFNPASRKINLIATFDAAGKATYTEGVA